MAFEQNPTDGGLEIQSISDIKDELDQAHRDNLGTEVALGPDSIFGQFIATWSEQEALTQQLVQRMQAAFSRGGAEGVDLDAISSLFGSLRNAATQSQSVSGRCTGVATTLVLNGSLVTQDITGIVWEVVDGTDGIDPNFGYEIGGGGDITPVTMRATTTGPNTFASASTFVITTPIGGWTGFNVTSDIETFETGTDIEADGAFRSRGADEIFAGGNDVSGIKANVLRVNGVLEVQVFENRSCTGTSPDGIPPGEIEVVVTGGDDLEIAQAILDRIPPGTDSHGTVTNNLPDIEGNLIEVKFTRPTLIETHVQVGIVISNAEGTPPANVKDVVEAAILAFGNANSSVGQDILYQQFIGPIFVAMFDEFSGKYPIELIDVEVATGAVPAFDSVNLSIGNRERADYDSTRVVANFS